MTEVQDVRLRERGIYATLIAIALAGVLLLPALWNGYPLLQYDTGGYLARWYEGYLVPSRSTTYGLYLHLGERSHFWLNLAFQALVVLWITRSTLRVLGISRAAPIIAVVIALSATTALPFLASMLLTDIFAGLSVLSLFLLVVHGARFSGVERLCLLVFTAFSAATHSATFGVLFGLCTVGWVVRPWLADRISVSGLRQGSVAVALGAALLLTTNFALSGRLAWTPGGSGVAFGRMLQDGLVTRYLNDHCTEHMFKLCPYRNELPKTGDAFLWGHSVFNDLGRFDGLGDEMAYIAGHALLAYPVAQAKAALRATGEQLVSVATGEGSHNWLAHTYGIIEHYLPQEVAAMKAAHQQHSQLKFSEINRVHVPVALMSMVMLVVLLANATMRRELDDVALLAGTVVIALLGNAFLCGVLSGPHDRYGARMVWLATFVVVAAGLLRYATSNVPARLSAIESEVVA